MAYDDDIFYCSPGFKGHLVWFVTLSVRKLRGDCVGGVGETTSQASHCRGGLERGERGERGWAGVSLPLNSIGPHWLPFGASIFGDTSVSRNGRIENPAIHFWRQTLSPNMGVAKIQKSIFVTGGVPQHETKKSDPEKSRGWSKNIRGMIHTNPRHYPQTKCGPSHT